MDDFVDQLFRMHSMAPPMLLRDGQLRPAVRAAAASLILHFPERKRRGQAHQVHAHLINVIEQAKLYDAGSSADSTLTRWSAVLRTKFERDNMHLLLPSPAASDPAEMHAKIIQHITALCNEVNQLREEIVAIRAHQNDHPMMPEQKAGTPLPPPHPEAALEAVTAPPSDGPQSPAAVVDLRELPPLPSFLPASQASQELHVAMKEKLAADVFDSAMKRGGNITGDTKQATNKMKRVVELFGGLASSDELKLFKNPQSDMGERLKVLKNLNVLAVAHLRDYFVKASSKVPNQLQPANQHKLKASAVTNRIDELKKNHGVAVKLDRTSLQSWRSAHEARKRPSPAGGGGDGSGSGDSKRARTSGIGSMSDFSNWFRGGSGK